MQRLMLLVVILWALSVTTQAADLALPNAKLKVPAPAGWSTLAVDLSKPFGTTDLIMDDKQERFITFMIIPPDGADDLNGFLRGLINGLNKRAAATRTETLVGKVARTTVLVELPGEDGPDRRSYVLFPELGLLVLVQYPIAGALNQPEVMAVLEGLRRTAATP